MYAAQEWKDCYINYLGKLQAASNMEFCVCQHCKKLSYWFKEQMIVPTASPVPPTHPDLPDDCRADYEEARDIVARSPRGAAALLRLVIQKLMLELGEKGKKIDDDIASLVKKGLPREVQQALDICRVVGNNAVHPGEIDSATHRKLHTKCFA